MPEIKSDPPNAAVTPPAEGRPPAVPPPASPGQTRICPAPEMAKAPTTLPEPESAAVAGMPATPEHSPFAATPSRALRPQARTNYIWIVLPLVALLAILAVFLFQPKEKTKGTPLSAGNPESNSTDDLSNYSAFVAQNKALIEKAPEQLLTDEAFAGQAPLAVGAAGPLVSPEIDPQLAALVDALRVRVQVMQGSQSQRRNNVVTLVSKGEFRGFKVQAMERIENGRIVAEEATVITPRNGVLKTVGRVLSALQKADHAAVISEVQAAGMEFSPLPAADSGKSFRGQLILKQYWGKPIAANRLIAEKKAGLVSLGLPLPMLKSRIDASDSILKRKILINDAYHDVYKVSDQGGNPLFFVYEKEGAVLGIWVVSESFKTPMGIGIGSSLDQIRLHYPVVTLSRSREKTPFAKVEGIDGILVLQGGKEKRVIAILIGSSPEFN